MSKLGTAVVFAAACCLVAQAGTLEVRPMGKPFRVRQIGAPSPTPQSAPVPIARGWELREGPTIDVVTGQILAPGETRALTTIYDNTVNWTGYYLPASATTIVGDDLRMINGGTVKKVTLSVFNGDPANKMLRTAIRVVYLIGPSNAPTIARSITSGQIDLTTAYPGGMAQDQGILITLDLSSLSPPLVLPLYARLGQECVNMIGTPAAPTIYGPGIFNPPVVGCSDQNFAWKIEVDPVQWSPPPIYDNTVIALNYGASYPPGAIFADDLIMAPTPPGEFLDRIDFSIFNGSTTHTLDSLDAEIVLRDGDCLGQFYYPEGTPTHSVTLALTNLSVNLPPNYGRRFYVAGLAPQRMSVATDILAGLRFRNFNPPSVAQAGQLQFYPPVKGGSADHFWLAGWPGYPDGWYWFGGNPYSAFYWGISTATPPSCATPGDMNCDGAVNNADIDGFIDALFGLETQYDDYLHSFPVYHPCDMLCADFSGDGLVNSQDIDAFIDALF